MHEGRDGLFLTERLAPFSQGLMRLFLFVFAESVRSRCALFRPVAARSILKEVGDRPHRPEVEE
jgi:hypothetical protein